jgi:hypothetical protein
MIDHQRLALDSGPGFAARAFAGHHLQGRKHNRRNGSEQTIDRSIDRSIVRFDPLIFS